jgi:maleamate amidohydrolase
MKKLRHEALDELLEGLPEVDAQKFRLMWREQEPWGLGAKPGVLVVDMMRGVVEEGYPLAAPSGEPCAKAIMRLVEVARSIGIPVVFTLPGVFQSAAEIGGWLRGMPVEEYNQAIGDVAGQMDFLEGLRPVGDEVTIVKPKPSAFFGTQLESVLTYLGVDTLIVTGMVDGRCVRATVEDAFAYNYHVIIPVECVAGDIDIAHKIELLDMGVHREVVADLVVLDDLLEELDAARVAD